MGRLGNDYFQRVGFLKRKEHKADLRRKGIDLRRKVNGRMENVVEEGEIGKV